MSGALGPGLGSRLALSGPRVEPDAELDRIARVVRRQLGVPVGLVTIVEDDRQVFPGLEGLGGWAGESRQTPLSHSFCQHVVRREGPLVVRDARTDPLVAANLAVGELGVVAYLGMPITADGETVLGSLCAIDTAPRDWTATEIAALEDLAALCSAELAGREAVAEPSAVRPVRRRPQRDDRQLRALVDSLPAMVGYWDKDRRNVVANTAYVTWFGKDPAEMVGSHLRDILGEDLYRLDEPHVEAALAGERREFTRTIVTPDGSTRHAQASYVPDVAEDGTVDGFFVHISDVSELTEAHHFHDAVLSASPDLIYVVDLRTGAVTWASGSFTELLGHRPEDVTALGAEIYRALIHPEDRDAIAEANAGAADLADGETIRIKVRARHKDGRYRWFLRRVTPFERDEHGRVVRVLGLTRDIQESVELTAQLEAAAVHDELTGLPNRRLLIDRLEIALNRQARTGRPVPVLYCDLDGFKRVNDTGGHLAGDEVLRATAHRITSLLRPEDTVARIGGDEFVVVLEPAQDARHDLTGPEHDLTVARELAGRIGSAVAEPVVVDGREHFVSVSIGIALARPHETTDEILRNADAAMYTAKSHGKARWEVFDRSLQDSALDQARVEAALRSALRPSSASAPRAGAGGAAAGAAPEHRAALTVAYQPIFDLATGALLGVEALARLRDEHGIAIPPKDFVPVAEETGLIGPLGRRVLETACGDLAAWHSAFPDRRDLGLAVNVSARQASRSDLLADVEDALERHGLLPSVLTLEVTESVLLDADRSTMVTLATLRDRGVQIAIDDFGTGYASLRYLVQLPVTAVKIDRSFTAGLPSDPMSASIVRAVSGLARDLGIECVVEGIETDAQLAGLPDGVLGQGFLLGRPMPEAQVRALLSRHDAPLPPVAHQVRAAGRQPADAARDAAGTPS